MADPGNLEKTYIHHVYRNGAFLGILQNVHSEFNLQQDINTAFGSILIDITDSPDRQFEAPEPILTEDGLPLTDELGQTLYTERAPDLIGNNATLIRHNNDVFVYEISPDYPNGKLVFSGWISRIRGSFGKDDAVRITCLGNGTELNNFILLGEALDQTQAEDDDILLLNSSIATPQSGMIITPIADATNLSKITLKLAAVTANNPIFTVKLYASGTGIFNLSRAVGGAAPTLTASVVVSSTSPTDYDFGFGHNFPIAMNYYAIIVECLDANGVNIYYDTGAGGSLFSGEAGRFYFSTHYSQSETSVTYNSTDPTIMFQDIIDSYSARGGVIDYDATSTDLTGLSRSYTFKVNTVLEGVKKCLELAPSDWYWYVDPATDIIYFKQTSATADHTLIYGRHIQSLDVESTVEDVKTVVYFTGGDTGGGVNLYKVLDDADNLEANNNRAGLTRMTDNRVTLDDTATALMENELGIHDREEYQTTVEVNAGKYDINLFNLGDTIGFAGFGNFVDDLILQIVHKSAHTDYVSLGLGVLPKRASAKVEEIQRALTDVETVYNPDEPS